MITMSGTPSLTILSEEQKFSGENLLQWKTNMTQLLASKGLSGYIDGSITNGSSKTNLHEDILPLIVQILQAWE